MPGQTQATQLNTPHTHQRRADFRLSLCLWAAPLLLAIFRKQHFIKVMLGLPQEQKPGARAPVSLMLLVPRDGLSPSESAASFPQP